MANVRIADTNTDFLREKTKWKLSHSSSSHSSRSFARLRIGKITLTWSDECVSIAPSRRWYGKINHGSNCFQVSRIEYRRENFRWNFVLWFALRTYRLFSQFLSQDAFSCGFSFSNENSKVRVIISKGPFFYLTNRLIGESRARGMYTWQIDWLTRCRPGCSGLKLIDYFLSCERSLIVFIVVNMINDIDLTQIAS